MTNENAVALKLPQFWASQPQIWFAQTEAQFHIRKITDETTKYYYVISALDQQTATRLADVLAAPPATDPYQSLKDRLLQTFCIDRRERAARLLRMRGLGDRKPSELMDEMIALLEGHNPCFIFEQIFLEQLPDDVRLQIANEDFSDLRRVALLADRLYLSRNLGASSSVARVSEARNRREKDLCYFHSRFGDKAKKCQSPCKWSGNEAAGRQ